MVLGVHPNLRMRLIRIIQGFPRRDSKTQEETPRNSVVHYCL